MSKTNNPYPLTNEIRRIFKETDGNHDNPALEEALRRLMNIRVEDIPGDGATGETQALTNQIIDALVKRLGLETRTPEEQERELLTTLYPTMSGPKPEPERPQEETNLINTLYPSMATPKDGG